jgi:hypothetical protein
MSNKRFNREVLQLRPDLRLTTGVFYKVPVGHVLCGYAFERTFMNAYASYYACPLYDRIDLIALTFGDRLPEPANGLAFEHSDDKLLAQEFVERIAAYDSLLARLSDPAGFADFVASRSILGNPRVRRGYAVTLVMLGRADEAREHLSLLSEMSEIAHYAHFHEDVNLLLRRLDDGIEAAQATLAEWERATRARFRIEQ